MANKTASEAITVKGTNPQFLVEKIIRTRIYESKYWKEDCFGLTGYLLFRMHAFLYYAANLVCFLYFSGNCH